MYQSILRPKEVVITDDNYLEFAPPQDAVIDGEKKGYGHMPRDYEAIPEGSMGFCAPFNLPLIPRSEWRDRIEKMERDKTRLSDVADQAGLKSLNQSNTNYCWTNAVITAMHTLRAWQNQPFVELSSASVAAKIKNYRNQGGWGTQALDYIVENGVAPASLWPVNYWQSNKYDTAECQAERKKYSVKKWWELKARSFDQMMTCLLLRIPVPIGLNWWSHEICAMDPVVIRTATRSEDCDYGPRIRNSWGDSYGDHGFAVLNQSKGTPDDAVAPQTADEL